MMNKDGFRCFVGIDLGSRLHIASVVDESGNFLGELGFEHTSAGISRAIEWVLSFAKGDADRIAVAVEKPHGAVVEGFLERAIAVFAINPKQLDRFRDRHTVSGAKDDRRDAFVLADSLRTDRRCFRQVHPPTAEIITLRELLRVDNELRKAEIAIANRLREQLRRCTPHLLKLAKSNLVDAFFWDVLERFANPEQARRADLESIQSLLRQRRIRRLKPEQVLEILRTPVLPAAQGTFEAALSHILLLAKQLRFLAEHRKAALKQIDERLAELLRADDPTGLTDAAILSSIPGVGRTVLATTLCEAHEAIRLRDLQTLRFLGGVAPVTKQSGRRRQILMRRACSHPLKNAFYQWALIAIQRDSRFKAHYDTLRTRGHMPARALRGVVDRMLSIAVAMLRDRKIYDSSLYRHRTT